MVTIELRVGLLCLCIGGTRDAPCDMAAMRRTTTQQEGIQVRWHHQRWKECDSNFRGIIPAVFSHLGRTNTLGVSLLFAFFLLFVSESENKSTLNALVAQDLSSLVVKEKWIVLLAVNTGYYDFFLNWMSFYQKLNVSLPVHVIAEDDHVYQKIEQLRLANVQVERSALDNNSTDAFQFGTEEYRKLVYGRPTHIKRKLEQGHSVFYNDIDTVWRRNPLLFILQAQNKLRHPLDLYVQYEFRGYLREWRRDPAEADYCTGIMAIRSNPITIQFISDWEDRLTQNPKHRTDQSTFNYVIGEDTYNRNNNHNRNNLNHAPLPLSEFPNGKLFFNLWKLRPWRRRHAVIVHANYMSGHDLKKERLGQHNLWDPIVSSTQ